MELRLKHLAPYLPYGLTVISFHHNIDSEEIVEGLNKDEFITDVDTFEFIHGKPILRPLCDLESEEFENRILNREYIIDKEADADLSYYEWRYLFEEHFDVFGLIEKGLAIDINTYY